MQQDPLPYVEKISDDTLIFVDGENDAMQLLFLILGLLLVSIAYAYGKTVGAMLVIVLVLGAWLTAKKKGML